MTTDTQGKPLWDWHRIDEEMEREYKAHGNTYQFIWVRHLLRLMAWEYDAALAATQARIAELEEECREQQVIIDGADELVTQWYNDATAAKKQLAELRQPAPDAWEVVLDGVYAKGQLSIDQDGTEISVFVDEDCGYVGVELPSGWRLMRPRAGDAHP